MNYRDERDALRGRIEGLEQDLQDARRLQEDDATKRARVEQIEARMRETEENLRAMRAELVALGAAPKPKKTLVPVFIGMGVAFLAAAMTGVFLARAPAPPPPPISRPPQQVAEPAPAPLPTPEIPTDDPLPLKPPAPPRQAKAQWVGKVTRIQGLAGGPGAPCIVDATLESGGNEGRVSELSVKCSGKVVYNSEDKLEGMSMLGYGFAEEPGKDAGTQAYAVKFSDTGARSGPRTQVSLDTTHGQGAVWSEVVPIFRVEFSVPTLSAPIKGDALLPAKKKGTNDLGF
jgi:hypothetical protein